MLCLTISCDVHLFVANIVQSTLFSEQHSLFDARDNNKANQIYFYRRSVRFTTASVFHFFLIVHLTPQVWTILPYSWMCISHYYFLFPEQSYRKKHILYDNDRQISAFK